MYRLPEQLGYYLLDSSKSMDIPGPLEDELKPYTPRNNDAIGSINQFMISGSNCKFFVEVDVKGLLDTEDILKNSKFPEIYLYEQSELQQLSNNTLEIRRKEIDIHCTDEDVLIDVSDCAVELPSDLEKINAQYIGTLEKLLDIFPEIKNCLDKEHAEFNKASLKADWLY